MAYECAKCGGLYLEPVEQCKDCGHDIVKEDAASIEARTGVKPMTFDGGERASTAKEASSQVWESAGVNPDGSLADDGVELENPPQSRWPSVSLERWWIKIVGNVRFAVQLVGIALVLITAYNMILYPYLHAEVWFGYRQMFASMAGVGAAPTPSLHYLADVLIMGAGAALAWFS